MTVPRVWPLNSAIPRAGTTLRVWIYNARSSCPSPTTTCYVISETGSRTEAPAPSSRNFPENMGRGGESALAGTGAALIPARGPQRPRDSNHPQSSCACALPPLGVVVLTAPLSSVFSTPQPTAGYTTTPKGPCVGGLAGRGAEGRGIRGRLEKLG